MGFRAFAAVGFAAITILAGCKTTSQGQGSSQMKDDGGEVLSVRGASAAAIFQLMQESGIPAETIDGHVIVGATNYKADTVHCSVIMNAEQTKKCMVTKSGKSIDVTRQVVNQDAITALDAMEARVDAELIGAINYEIKNVSCSRPVVPNPVVTCTYYQGGASALELNADNSDTIFAALSNAGVQPETIDGRLPTGAVNLKADQINCSIISDMNRTTRCSIVSKGRLIEIRDAGTSRKLAAVFGDIGAVMNPELIGAINYQVNHVTCSKGVFPGARASCSVNLP
jgi:hypothetical protein